MYTQKIVSGSFVVFIYVAVLLLFYSFVLRDRRIDIQGGGELGFF